MARISRDYPENSDWVVFLNGQDVSLTCTRFDTVDGWAIVDGAKLYGTVKAVKKSECVKCNQNPVTLEYLVTGTGHSATVWASKVIGSAGVSCGHERIFKDDGIAKAAERFNKSRYKAEVSWLAAPYLDNPLLHNAVGVHLVRHPLSVINSWMVSGTLSTRGHGYFANQHINFLQYSQNIDRAIARYVGWNGMIEGRAVLVRAEDGPEALLSALGIAIPESVFDNRLENQHARKVMNIDFSAADDVLLDALLDMSERYGYVI